MRLVVSSVERCKRLEMLAHVVLLKLLQKRNNRFVVGWFRWELDALFGEPVAIDHAELFVVCDVEEVDVLLRSSANKMGYI